MSKTIELTSFTEAITGEQGDRKLLDLKVHLVGAAIESVALWISGDRELIGGTAVETHYRIYRVKETPEQVLELLESCE